MVRRAALAFTFAMLLSACGGGSSPPSFKSAEVSALDRRHDFELTDHDGRPRKLADFKGKAVMLFFGVADCRDVCRSTLTEMARAVDAVGEEHVQGLFVTVDPTRDTPPALAKLVTAFQPSFLGLYADERRTAALTKSFRTVIRTQPAGARDRSSVDRSSAIYVYDRKGRLRLLMGPGTSASAMADDLRLLLNE
jgi:protein SCO1/2